jgi:hypothetical protein
MRSCKIGLVVFGGFGLGVFAGFGLGLWLADDQMPRRVGDQVQLEIEAVSVAVGPGCTDDDPWSVFAVGDKAGG